MGRYDTSSASWEGDFKSWMEDNLKSDTDFMFGIHCWMLWRVRNEQVFIGSQSSAASIAMRSFNWSMQVKRALQKEELTSGTEPNRRLIDVRWEQGPEGWVVVNTDGSVDQAAKRATIGGVIRTADCRCLSAFSMNIGTCSITRAEIRGAIEGLKRAWDVGHRKIVLRLDSLVATQLLTSSDMRAHQHITETMEFQDLIRRDWSVQVDHTFKEGNQTADFLANLGYGYPVGSHNVSLTDSRLAYFLRLDCFGITKLRSVLIND
ncbi:Putative ribonuclease H protein At1g65750 [Linum perenne]